MIRRPFSAVVIAVSLVLGLTACPPSPERIAERRAQAMEYYDNEQWNEAKIEFLNLLNDSPDDAEAHFRLGETLFNLESYADGIWQFKEAVRLDPNNMEWRLRLAQVMFAARQYDESRENVDALLEREPANVDGLLLRGGIKSVKNDIDGLLADVDAALEIEPDNKSALAIKAQALGGKGDIAGAEEYLRRLLEVDPSTANHLTMARFLSTLGRQDEALVASRQAIEASEDPEARVGAQLNLANQYLNMGEKDSAFQVLIDARKENPTNGTLILTLARLYYANNERDRSEELLEEHVDQDPDNPGPRLVLADYYRLIGERQRAIESVDRALRVDPDSEQAKLRRAEYLHDGEGSTDQTRAESWDIVRDVLERNPKSTLGHFTEGKFHLIEGKYDEAATSLRRVLDDQPSANAHVLLGTAYQQQKQLELARSEFQQALQLDAQNMHARTSLASLYLEIGENELAAREAEIAARVRPGDTRVLIIWAGALTRLERHAQAREVLSRIGDGSDLIEGVRLQLARLYRQANDLPTARRILNELIDNPGLRTAVQGELVACDVQARKPREAIDRITGWIEQEPERAELYLFRGRVRLGLMRGDRPAQPVESEADLRAAIERGLPGTQAHMLLSGLFLRMGELEKAIGILNEARTLAPNDTNVPFQLAGIYERQGKLVEARENYEAVLRLDQDQPVVKNNLAWILANADNPTDEELDRAMQLAQDAKEALPNNPSVADTLGWVMLKKDIPSAAISLFHEAIAQYPEAHPLRGTVRYHLAKAYERNGELDRAIAELTRALDEVPSFAEREATEQMLKELRSG